MSIQSLAVFCGSKNGNNPLFIQHTAELGTIMGKNNITLVYGGGSVGLMGKIADSVLSQEGKVIGVIPQVLVDWERQHNGITQLIIVEDMHIRKKKMYELCDAAIILPGGFGTMDEFFEMLTWNQLSIHDKELFILNSDGYYDHLIHLIQHMEKEGFLHTEAVRRINIISEPQELLSYISSNN